MVSYYTLYMKYIIVISQFEYDVFIITQVQGEAEDECNKDDYSQITGLFPNKALMDIVQSFDMYCNVAMWLQYTLSLT